MMYVDDYSIIDTGYIIHACLVNPCAEHAADHPWGIGLLLGLGKNGTRAFLEYPTREYRDAAFEQIGEMVRADQGLDDEDAPVQPAAPPQYYRYTVLNDDTGERFSTTDYETQDEATRERNRLAIRYGKGYALSVAGIDAEGHLYALDAD